MIYLSHLLEHIVSVLPKKIADLLWSDVVGQKWNLVLCCNSAVYSTIQIFSQGTSNTDIKSPRFTLTAGNGRTLLLLNEKVLIDVHPINGESIYRFLAG